MFGEIADRVTVDIASRLLHLCSAIAHSIAGTAATYGLSRLSTLARELSNLAAKGGPDTASLGPIEAEYRTGATTLRALLDT